MSSTEIIVLEPTGKQKKYSLKPHGDLDKIQKKWKSHLKTIGASWSDNKKMWLLSRDKLRDFEKVQTILSKDDEKKDEKAEDNEEKKSEKKRNKRNKENTEEDDDEEDDESSSSSSDEEVIEFLKNKIRNTIRSPHGNKILAEDIDNSDEEDVIRLSRRIRHIMLRMSQLDKRVSELEQENAFLYKSIEQLKKH